MRRIITAIVYNKSGVLSRITSVLNRRQVNIESISVGVVEAEISRMTIVINVNTLSEAEQVTKQLNKQIEVVKVSDITDDPHIERELALIQVNAPMSIRSEIQAVIAPFRADIVDVAQKTIIIQVVGTHDKIDAFIDVLRPYGIKQLARTGITGIKRG
ncbi:acetolactate synthase small subunit [Enterococcus saccharolyticus]|uniref:Acetolactate synthase small subunit n=1 Tax=Enterococcus saccharolyticus subsp. saccharolyticus ATCC 43076 TaxID=1139996 RepID=S0NZ22_9ENTE|nr:acetolactate synthase small subunit [Enterococcus saccharolyticus]EOT29035.1 acetolactate synthase, small subunit [Enterococcus saccharolyticus subsp. saccharolyticus ATCC 43076]EOT81401.1 acetolactate synthase, small subunit [Enterococcus saccharolyticus subsp. saccharolyticus ATCC 43076]